MLKEELQKLGLKCGGRPIERAERLIAARANIHTQAKPDKNLQMRNERQNAKRGRDEGDQSNNGLGGKLATATTRETKQKKARPSDSSHLNDDEILALCKANQQPWVRWLKARNIHSAGSDPLRHAVAVRRQFYEDQPAGRLKQPAAVAGGDQLPPASPQPLIAKLASKRVAAGTVGTRKAPRLSTKLSRARELGVAQSALDDAMDSANPHTAVEAAVAAKLGGEKLSALLRAARAAGVDSRALDVAMDGPDAKAVVIALLGGAEAAGGSGGGADPEAAAVPTAVAPPAVRPPYTLPAEREAGGANWASVRGNFAIPAGAFDPTSAGDQALLQRICVAVRASFLAFLRKSPLVSETKQNKGARRNHDPSRHASPLLAAFVGSLQLPSERETAWALFDANSSEHRLLPSLRSGQPTARGGGGGGGGKLSIDAGGSGGGGGALPFPMPSPRAGRSFTYPRDCPIWELVSRTEAHPLYDRLYGRLPSSGTDWLKTERKMPALDGGAGTTAVEMLGLDCEMAATTQDDRALIALGIAAETAAGVREIVLDTLVMPPHPVRNTPVFACCFCCFCCCCFCSSLGVMKTNYMLTYTEICDEQRSIGLTQPTNTIVL